MRYTTIQHDDTSVIHIANRLFSCLTDESLKTAKEAILRLNPELLQAKALKPGLIIKVPERLAGLNLNENQISADPIEETKTVIKMAIESYESQLKGRVKTLENDLKSQNDLLMKVKRVVDSDEGESFRFKDELVQKITILEKSVKARINDNEAFEKNLENMFNQINSDLSS